MHLGSAVKGELQGAADASRRGGRLSHPFEVSVWVAELWSVAAEDSLEVRRDCAPDQPAEQVESVNYPDQGEQDQPGGGATKEEFPPFL